MDKKDIRTYARGPGIDAVEFAAIPGSPVPSSCPLDMEAPASGLIGDLSLRRICFCFWSLFWYAAHTIYPVYGDKQESTQEKVMLLNNRQ